MIDFENLSLTESTIFENYASKGYDDFQLALKLADERVSLMMLKTKGEWTKNKLSEFKRAINDEIQASYGGLFEAIQGESVATAEIVLGATIGEVGAALPKATINDLINSKRPIRMSEEKVYGFKELFKIESDNHARQLRALVSSGVANGLTAEQIVRQYGIKSTKLSKGYIVGDIRTVIGLSRDEGRYQAFKKLEASGAITGYVYDATLDSGTTQYCREHDQIRYFKPIEEIRHLIKTHGQCRSIFTPWSENQSKTRPSQGGEVEMQNYESWFKKQPDSLKRSTLTNRKYQAFLDGKYKVKSIMDLDKKVPIDTIKKELFKASKV